MLEFFWRAVYYDGSTTDQHDLEGNAVARGYEDIDRDRLMTFELREVGTQRLVHRVFLGGDKRLIWRRRVFMKLGREETVIHLVGWQKTIEGRNVQAISFVFPDGHTELVDRWHENHPIFHSVSLREEEI